jgi:hypothetical protein
MTGKNSLVPRNAPPNEYSSKKLTMLLARYSNHFRSERSEDEWAALFKDYVRLLADVPYELVEKACLNLWRTKTWYPKVAEIREEAERLAKAQHVQTQEGVEPLHVRLDKESKTWAKSFMQGDLGRQARAEGWGDLLSGWICQLAYRALSKAHLEGGEARMPTSVPTEVIERYRKMRPPLVKQEGSQFDALAARAKSMV